ncbi:MULTISPECIES: NAD-binding protein [Haloarcula]|uniref:Potassium channel protein n=1 Tax=Haloarcula pellucida TaxID=1427151 RepID=A0A830GJK0_9EURY|nr:MULTISPECIES: NAD-binding protein [Halomicroarcula]MBX0348470.1 NAD-binding protein [Halomicroarcula pellucida]MDS0278294.1 NAD-binding protein [Halomicroarcula sp. S1AR25-4]GGN93220.1 potassium channel protein [Halomicroarcula pellucida]
MDWSREWLGTRATILLPTLVAVLSFATGVANITAPISGILGTTVPESLQQAAGFTGALTGFSLLLSVLGLRRRLRIAWYVTVVLLPVSALQGVVQSSPLSLPLVVLSLVSLPTVLLNRRRFDRKLDLSTTQLAAGAALLGAQVYGTVGTWALREEFVNVETLTDAFYYTLVTASTVGYGDVTPVSERATLFGMSVVVLGTASFAIALGSLLGPALEKRFAEVLGNMTDAQLDLLENHVVVLGYGDLTEPILEELVDATDFVVITPDSETAARLQQRDIAVLTADPSDEEPLRRAGIEDARAAVAATNDDAQDALAILTAHSLNPDLNIVAAATERENIEKLRRAGASTVISPALIGGHLLVQSALGREGMENIADHLLDIEREDDADI